MSTEINIDTYGHKLHNVTPKGVALARNVLTPDASQNIALNSDTTYLRVYAIAKDVYLKWALNDQDYCKADNFDEVIPAGQVIDFGIPVLATTGQLYDNVQFVGRESGATVVVIEK